MELPATALRLPGEDADLGHQVVADLALDLERGVDVDLARVRAQVLQLGGGDEPAASLRLGERDPHGAPQSPPLRLGEQFAQLGVPVSPGER